MKVSVFGLGYVGTVTAACLAGRGHEVVGVDPNTTKVGIVNAGKSPIVEEGLGELMRSGVRAKRLRAVVDSEAAVLGSDISIVCVGTPSRANGALDLTYVERVSREIGLAIAKKKTRHLVVLRSTVLPGTTEGTVIPILEQASGKQCGKGFGVCFNPEFLRESTSLKDFNDPPRTVIGSLSPRDATRAAALYKGIKAPLVKVSLRTAEMVKYVDNVFHALKVSFGNEIGRVCQSLGLDSHEVMDIFCLDTKLNLSPYYLKPGFAYGGSCLPKDLRAFLYSAKVNDAEIPIIQAIAVSNEVQVKSAVRRIVALGKKRIGVLGFAFKAGTDDLRESPVVELIERLLGKGYDLRLFDESVNVAKLFGANKEYIERHIPHIADLMVSDVRQVLKHADVVVVGNRSPEFKKALRGVRPDQHVFDLVRLTREARRQDNYEGMSW